MKVARKLLTTQNDHSKNLVTNIPSLATDVTDGLWNGAFGTWSSTELDAGFQT